MNKPYILSVDDEEINQEIIVDLLEDNFDIKIVSGGRDCLESVSNKLPQLILLDVNMPDMNGLETCIALKQNQQSKNIPIIFVSALASPAEIQAGFDAGVNEYVTKPFDEYRLIEIINSYLV